MGALHLAIFDPPENESRSGGWPGAHPRRGAQPCPVRSLPGRPATRIRAAKRGIFSGFSSWSPMP